MFHHESSRAIGEFRDLGLGLVAHDYRIWECEMLVGQSVGDWMMSGRAVNIETVLIKINGNNTLLIFISPNTIFFFQVALFYLG